MSERIDMSFGALFRAIRLKNRITLRQFCIERGLDTGNVSKLERNLIGPPYDNKKILFYLNGLKFTDLDLDFLRTAAQNYYIGRIAERFER